MKFPHRPGSKRSGGDQPILGQGAALLVRRQNREMAQFLIKPF